MRKYLTFGLWLVWVTLGQAAQGPAQQTVPLSLPLQGIKVDPGRDGTWERIYGTATQTVTFPDRRGIATAYTIAEEKAKANIVRFFNQQIATSRTIQEITAEVDTAISRQGTGADGMSVEAKRNLSTSLTELFRSSASATLAGVQILEQTYDEPRKEVTVKVGISRAGANLARDIQRDISGRGNAERGPRPAAAGGTREEVVRQPSEVRSGGTLVPNALSFTAARGFVRSLALRTEAEWQTYVRSGDKPEDIPSDPDVTYRSSGWISWADWLGAR